MLKSAFIASMVFFILVLTGCSAAPGEGSSGGGTTDGNSSVSSSSSGSGVNTITTNTFTIGDTNFIVINASNTLGIDTNTSTFGITNSMLMVSNSVITNMETTNLWRNITNAYTNTVVLLYSVTNDFYYTNKVSLTNCSGFYTLGMVCISPAGSDSNPGSFDFPFLSLQAAIERAVFLGITNVRVQSGIFSPGSGLNAESNGIYLSNINNMSISGGWNSGFTSQAGYSQLDGGGSLFHVMYICSSSGLNVSRIVLRNGTASGTSVGYNVGGGIFLNCVTNITLTNCIFSNNTAQWNPAISLCEGYQNKIVGCVISCNICPTQYSGGAVCIGSNSSYNLFNSTVENNVGGGIDMYYSRYNTILGISRSNRTNSYGSGPGVNISQNCYGNSVQVQSYNNEADGVAIWAANSNAVLCTVYGNGANGMVIQCGRSNFISSQIHNNGIHGIWVANWGESQGFPTFANVIGGKIYSNNMNGVWVNGGQNNIIDGAVLHDNYYEGVALFTGLNFTIRNSSIYDNNRTFTNSSEIWVYNSFTNLIISNNMLTNINIPSGAGINLFWIGLWNGLTIANNTFAGVSGQWASGLYEWGPDSTGFTLINNTFRTNNMAYLMVDFNNGGTMDIDSLNNAVWSGALSASGNSAQ